MSGIPASAAAGPDSATRTLPFRVPFAPILQDVTPRHDFPRPLGHHRSDRIAIPAARPHEYPRKTQPDPLVQHRLPDRDVGALRLLRHGGTARAVHGPEARL